MVKEYLYLLDKDIFTFAMGIQLACFLLMDFL